MCRRRRGSRAQSGAFPADRSTELWRVWIAPQLTGARLAAKSGHNLINLSQPRSPDRLAVGVGVDRESAVELDQSGVGVGVLYLGEIDLGGIDRYGGKRGLGGPAVTKQADSPQTPALRAARQAGPPRRPGGTFRAPAGRRLRGPPRLRPPPARLARHTPLRPKYRPRQADPGAPSSLPRREQSANQTTPPSAVPRHRRRPGGPPEDELGRQRFRRARGHTATADRRRAWLGGRRGGRASRPVAGRRRSCRARARSATPGVDDRE